MNLLLIGHDAGLTGAPRFLLELAKWLRNEKKCELTIILRNGGPLLDEYRAHARVVVFNECFSIQYLINNRVPQSVRSICRSLWNRVLNIDNYDLVFCNTSTNGSILRFLDLSNVPVISRIPELKIAMKQWGRNDSVFTTLRKSTVIIAVSDAVKENILNTYRVASEKIRVIYGSLPQKDQVAEGEKSFKCKYDLPMDSFIVGGCGTVDWRKGIDSFIRVARLFFKIHPDAAVRYVWLGGTPGSLDYEKAAYDIQKMNLEGKVIIVPPTNEPMNVMAHYDVFLMTSREDPFPLVNLEIGQKGIPIIGYRNSGGSQELLEESGNILVDYLDEEVMAQSVVRLYENTNLRIELGDRLKKTIANNFCHDKLYEEIYRLLEETIVSFGNAR